MRILHLRTSNFYGGPERQIHQHALLARSSGMDLVVGTLAEGGNRPPWMDPLADDGLDLMVVPVSSSYDLSAISTIRRYLATSGIDIVCSHDYRTTVLVAVSRRCTGWRWVAFSRGSTRENLKVRLFNLAELIAIRMADRVVAVSRGQARKLLAAGLAERKIRVVPNAVAVGPLSLIQALDLRKRFRLPPESLVVVAAGRFSPEKGQRILVQAAAASVPQAPHLRFVLYGDGPDLARLRAQTEALGLTGRVFLPGFEPEILPCIAGADIVVNPSISEAMPNVVLEAMAMSRCVIATDVGGVPELILDGSTGLLVPPRSVSALSAAISRAAADESMRAHLGLQARAHVEQNFSFADQFSRLQRVYASLT